ncbi:MAG: class I SAM-dependent methyltransferase [Betaproteobacteria bacterium]|nr:class I SAM-dependent methyltransferase [Betaproteobacteria bacterium]
MSTAGAAPLIHWLDLGMEHCARWRSARGLTAPRRVMVAGDTMKADTAWHHACEGTALLWRGDYQNARQLLSAMARRADQSQAHRAGQRKQPPAPTGADAFNRYRMAQAQRARTLGMLLVPFRNDFSLALTRAQDVREACAEAWGAPVSGETSVASLRELLGIIGAHEWRRKGIEVPVLGARIHPRYGVFAPVRSEYIDFVATAPLPAALSVAPVAFDIGTGTGVLAAVLAKRGVPRIVATDQDANALACARENIARLGLGAQVEVVEADLFPAVSTHGKAALIVCNPPWIPARPGSPLERAVYDPEGRMLRGFLGGLAAHLVPGGESWLILSDIAERLGLRTREDLQALIDGAGLVVIARMDTHPVHARAADAGDPLHAARRDEITSLWRLAAR